MEEECGIYPGSDSKCQELCGSHEVSPSSTRKERKRKEKK